MLPFSNFMKKMVENPQQSSSDSGNASGTFGKLKQTLSSSLLTAQDKVNKMSPNPRPSLIPDTMETQPLTQPSPPEPFEKESETSNHEKNEPNKSANRARESSCRVCLKSFKQGDFSKKCFECKYRVCEDCASYSKMDSSEDLNTWRCSVCRRKMSSRICIPQDSTDSNLDVPVLEALQRRHSDVKLNTNNTVQIGLQPPRSPELRRHSDVSPASLKELTNLEKLKGGTRTGSTNETEWVNMPISIEPPSQAGSRRQSIRVSRQHSYDDDIQKNAIANKNAEIELSLGLPGQIPRRKSAYDVFGGIQITPNQLQKNSEPEKPGGSRRSSFRIPAQDDFEKDESPSPDNGPTLLIDDDRRIRRRGSQLPDISALRERGVLGTSPASTLLSVNPSVNPYQGPALEDLEAPKRQTSLDGESIKIVIHDVDSGQLTTASKRRVILRRDPNEKAHRTRGFGMRVVGGKTGADGKLFAAIVWTVPGGPAEKGGLQQGDKILEWCGVSLVDRSFEEVCSIMSFSESNDIAEILVEHASDFRMSDFLEDTNVTQHQPISQNSNLTNPVINVTQRKNSDVGLIAESENNDKREPASPTRRKLPKTPEQIAKEKQVSGRVQIQIWFHELNDRNELVVSLMAADDLAIRDEQLGFGILPEAYAKIKILPKVGEGNSGQTEVSIPNQSPIWNATMSFDIGSGANLSDQKIEVTLWDLIPQSESIFLGECEFSVQKAFLEDRAVWYRLEDPKSLRAQTIARCNNASNTPYNLSPRGSATLNSDVSRFIRHNYSFQRSVSDDCDSIGESNSLLHPDHAWGGTSRRGSSQSETLEIETYQLGKDFSKSLPGSRRSSFQDQEKKSGAASPAVLPVITRRRSSCIKKDPDEILRSLKAVRGELGRTIERTMSLSRAEEYGGDYRPTRRMSRVHRDSMANFSESFSHDENLRGSSGNFQEGGIVLGPLQKKNTYQMTYSKFGDLLLDFKISRTVIEMSILSCRNLMTNYSEQPDTFVEIYIKDAMNGKIRQKKKTNIVRQNQNPNYNFSVSYAMSDVYRRSLILIVWQKAAGFEKSIALGAVEIYFSKFSFDSWNGVYPLYPAFSLEIPPNYEP